MCAGCQLVSCYGFISSRRSSKFALAHKCCNEFQRHQQSDNDDNLQNVNLEKETMAGVCALACTLLRLQHEPPFLTEEIAEHLRRAVFSISSHNVRKADARIWAGIKSTGLSVLLASLRAFSDCSQDLAPLFVQVPKRRMLH